jgi:DNA-binding CsgD family transcriptional regulator
MNSPEIFNLQALMQALEQIHSTMDLAALPEKLFSAVRALIPGATLTLVQRDLKTGVVTSFGNEDLWSKEQIPHSHELMPTHPVVPAYKAGWRGAIRVTDRITLRQFEETPHCREILLPVGLRYQTVVTLDVPGKIAGMTVIRDRTLTDWEVKLLRLIAPQIELAFRNAQNYTALMQATAATIPAPEDLQRLGLTPREAEVLHWVIKGKRNCEIATIIGARIRTVGKHVERILAKLGVETRTAAANIASEILRLR